jgi:AraC-like DNA-binding protein
MPAEASSLSYGEVLEVVLAFSSAYGAALIWHLPRYRALAHYLIYQTVLMVPNISEAHSTGFLVTPLFTMVKGPLLYLYMRAMVNEKRLRGPALYGQFLPPLVLLVMKESAQVAIVVGSVSQVLYLGLSFRLLHRYHRAAQSFRSDAQSLRLTWLTVAYWMITAQAVIGLVRLNLQRTLDQAILINWFCFDLTLLLGVCCFLVFKATRQPLLYDDMLAYENAGRRPPPADRQAEKVEAASVFARLESLILHGELYLRPRLSVEDLANRTGLQMKDVSWAFNVGAGISFNDYINRLRAGAFKKRLQRSGPGGKSLLEIAFETGFNSKSSFNATFKREVGMTPSQYLKRRPGGDFGLGSAEAQSN